MNTLSPNKMALTEMSQTIQETSVRAPANTPVFQMNGALPLGVVQLNQTGWESGPPANFEVFLNEVCLRLETVRAHSDRQLSIWKYQDNSTSL